MEEKKKSTIKLATLPMLVMRGLVLFPNTTMHFDVGREKSILALKSAMDADHKIFLVSQDDITIENPDMKNVFKIGVVAHIKQLLKADKNTIRVLVEGEYKAKIESITEESPFFVANVKRINKSTKKTCDENEQLALVRLVKDIFAKYCQELPNVPKELVFNIKGEENPEKLFNAIVSNILI
ncbi:MAG: LON peptidase substrate-binding domain-containing protein, partial [Oscillospiraceae bacterium]